MRKILCLLLMMAPGCGNSVSVDKACGDLAEGLCGRLDSCAAPLITTQYGDVATCQTRAKLTCPSSLMAPNTSATPARFDDCAKQLTSLSCNALFTRDSPDVCKPEPGKLANGSACGDDAQCTSAFCKKAASQVCGVCGTRGQAGAACSINEDCDFKLGCANQVCAAYGAVGATCDGSHPCAPPNACKNAVCAAPVGLGQACDPVAKDCDATKALFCNPATMMCIQATFAAAGQPCGFVNGGVVACSGSGHCKLAAASFMGTCLAAAADGAACDSTNGPDCMPPAQCVGSVCKLPNPASCM